MSGARLEHVRDRGTTTHAWRSIRFRLPTPMRGSQIESGGSAARMTHPHGAYVQTGSRNQGVAHTFVCALPLTLYDVDDDTAKEIKQGGKGGGMPLSCTHDPRLLMLAPNLVPNSTRSTTPQWRPIRFRLPICTYTHDTHPRGVRVDEPTEPRTSPTPALFYRSVYGPVKDMWRKVTLVMYASGSVGVAWQRDKSGHVQ